MEENEACQARNPKVLEEEIMSSSFAKNDREWWAKGEIERLRNIFVGDKLRKLAKQFYKDQYEHFSEEILNKFLKDIITSQP